MDRIDTIILFAAGFGKRMQDITLNTPKPLITINNIPVLYYVLSLINTYKFKKIIINTHYLAHKIEDAVKEFQKNNKIDAEIVIVYEPEILETGGAVKNVAKFLGNKPIFTCNSDIIIKSENNIFDTMINSWNADVMDFLLLLQPLQEVIGFAGNGDFNLESNNGIYNKVLRNNLNSQYEYLYSGISIINPNLIYENPQQYFSLREYYINDRYRVFGTSIANLKLYHLTNQNDIRNIEKLYC